MADKLISFSATDTHIRHRDLWDIPWIVRAQEIDFPAVAALVAAKHDDYRCPVPLASMIAVGMQRAHVCYADGSFTGQMQRFLSPAVLNRTHDFDNRCDALNAIVEKCYDRVAASLGISDQVEHARRRLATEISSGLISAAGMPKKESWAFLRRWVRGAFPHLVGCNLVARTVLVAAGLLSSWFGGLRYLSEFNG